MAAHLLKSRQPRTEASFILFGIYSNPFERLKKPISVSPLSSSLSSADALQHGASILPVWLTRTDDASAHYVCLLTLLNCHSGCQTPGTEMDSSWIQQVIAAYLFVASRWRSKDRAHKAANCSVSNHSEGKEYLHCKSLELLALSASLASSSPTALSCPSCWNSCWCS